MLMTKVSTGQIFKIFLKQVKPFRGLAFLILASIALAEGSLVAVPWFYKKFFDTLTAAGSPAEAMPHLVSLLLAIFALHGGHWIFYRVANLTNNHFQPRVMVALQRLSFANILSHSYSFFANNFVGSLVRKVQRLARSFEDISDNAMRHFFQLSITITGSLIALYMRSPKIALITAIWVALFILGNYLVSIWKLKYDERKAAKDSEVTGVIADAFTNSTNIKLFTSLDNERSLFAKVTDEYRRLQTLTWNLAEINDAFQIGFIIIIEFAVMYLAVGLWSRGQLTIGDFALFQGYLISLFNVMWNLGRIIRRSYESIADAKEMVAILHTPFEIADKNGAKKLTVKNGGIIFKDATFGYRSNRNILDKFNLKISPREKVAFVGPSGSGKSTLAKLILRFHDIQAGKIIIDKQDISLVTQNSLREQISLVPQDPILFHRTLRENIRYGRPQASDAAVALAASQARCANFIEKLSSGYDTYVGERGIKLSGGERQRVAIARAILKNAPILILDEATSSLDSESEALIQEALEVLMKDKTTIVIAHRLSTILKMDRIVVIDNGQVAAMGTHNELMRENGLYKKLWEIQSSGFLK